MRQKSGKRESRMKGNGMKVNKEAGEDELRDHVARAAVFKTLI